MSMGDTARVDAEIADLEARLEAAKARLNEQRYPINGDKQSDDPGRLARSKDSSLVATTQLHNILLLADSALPLGSFAFSSGLESFLAHTPKHKHTSASLDRFLTLSLASYAGLTLPFVVSGYQHPEQLEDLDNDLDASTSCVVAKRASIKQGRALLGLWERSFLRHVPGSNDTFEAATARTALHDFSQTLKAQPSDATTNFHQFCLHGHLPPLFGTTCAALLVPLTQALYVYLLNHAKTLISAAIRASIVGPYQAQSILVSEKLQARIRTLVELEVGPNGLKPHQGTENAGQNVPMLDIWGGRHEIVYSRIFNS